MNQEQTGLPQLSDSLRGHDFNGTQSPPATQTPHHPSKTFGNLTPVADQGYGEPSLQNGQNATSMPEVKQELLKMELLYDHNWTIEESTADLGGRKLPSASSLPQGGAEDGDHNFMQSEEEMFQKRQLRLTKNRLSVNEYRRKKANYVRYLENRMAMLEKQNRSLREKLRVLKDVF